MDKRLLIILIVLGVVIFLVGVGVGVISQKQSPSNTNQVNNSQTNNDAGLVSLAKTLKSTPINSIGVFGTVTNISGKAITVESKNDSVKVKVANDAKIFNFVQTTVAGKTTSSQKAGVFGDIKVGSNVSMGAKITADNTLEVSSVVIFPVVQK